MLKVDGLSKEFLVHQCGRRIEGFRDVSFSVDKGRFFGLSGQSGSGKSSLMKCIYRTYLPTSGRMIYESAIEGNVDLVTLSELRVLDLRRREIGYVSQFLQAVPRVSAVDVVAEPLTRKGIHIERARDEASSILERFLLPKRLFDAYPTTFSGGEQQRVNLARAMIAGFNFLLLDEPTSSLDDDAKEIVGEMLREEGRRDTTMICISHDRSFLESLADRIGVMREGRMVEVLEL